MTRTVHVAVYDTFVDWEIGHAIDHIRKPLWHVHPGEFRVVTVGATAEPVTTMGGLRLAPDTTLDAVEPTGSAMLILSGNDIWNTAAFVPFAEKAQAFLAAGVPVAAICGATGGLAVAGLLDDRPHTSNAKEFLAGIPEYRGGEFYQEVPAVTDGSLITASSVAPVEFAREILAELGVFSPETLASWFKLYGQRDPAGFYELMAG